MAMTRLPEPRLTPRLSLLPITSDEADHLQELHADPVVARWYGGTWSWQQAQQRAVAMEQHWREHGVGKWLAFRRVDGELVGRGGLSRSLVDDVMRLEVGWAVRSEFQGEGYATEIGQAAVDFAHQLGEHEIVSFTEVHNTASRAVMTRLGMRYQRDIYRPGLLAGVETVQPQAPFALYALRIDGVIHS